MMCYALFRNEPQFVTIPAGAKLFSEGDPPNIMYVLIVGEASLSIGGREMELLRPGAVVGEMSLIDPQPHSATVRAISDCEFACVDEKRFDFLVAETPGFALEIMQNLVQRLRAADRLLTQRPAAAAMPPAANPIESNPTLAAGTAH